MEKIQQIPNDSKDLIREINIRLNTMQRLIDNFQREINLLEDRVTILETP